MDMAYILIDKTRAPSGQGLGFANAKAFLDHMSDLESLGNDGSWNYVRDDERGDKELYEVRGHYGHEWYRPMAGYYRLARCR